MEKYNNIKNKRNKLKKITTTSQISNNSINNTSISTPNISILNNNKNKSILKKSSTFSEDIPNNIGTNEKNKILSPNLTNKRKRSSIPFRKDKTNKLLINSKSLKIKNNINDNSNILNNSSDSKTSNESKTLTLRSYEPINKDIKCQENLNLLISKESKNIEVTPFKKKTSFSFMNSGLSLDSFDNFESNNIKTISKKANNTGKKINKKYNLYSIKSFNAAKISWSKEKRNNIKKPKKSSGRKFSKTQSKFSPNKSFFYKDKKLNIQTEKFEDFKHFSPLVKNKYNSKDRIFSNKKYFKNKLKISRNSPIKNKDNYNNVKRENYNKNEINKNNNTYNFPQLPIINVQIVNKKDRNKNGINKNNDFNNLNYNNINNIPINQISKELEKNSNIITNTKEFKPKIIPNSFQDLNHVITTSQDLKNFKLNNLRITKQINDNLEKFIDNSHCVYCLKRVIKPITLSCGHELCLLCSEEIISLYKFIHIPNLEIKFIKCPKCKTKSEIINNDINNLLRLNWCPPHSQEESDQKVSNKQNMVERKLQLCEICPNSKYVKDLAEFECLNCDIILCYECRMRHLSNPRHQDHKIIPYTKILQEKVELSLCDIHREPTKLFCETCMKSICVICAQYDKDHENHQITTIKNIIDSQTIELTGNIRVCEEQIKVIDDLIIQMVYSKDKLEEEKNIFLNNVNKTINDLIQLIHKKKEELINYINDLFVNKLENLENKLKNFKLVKNRYEYYRNLICDRDIDIIDRVIQMKKLNKKILKIENLGLLNSSNFNKSFSQSLFINEPYKEIEKTLNKYSFFPITDLTIDNIIKIFSNSKIIKKEYIYKDFIIILPKIKSGILLYSTLTDGISTIIFHKKCDNKGPTLTIVKTVDGHIFGGYNPRSWVSESMYNECDNSFIFSLSDGKNIKPIKCPLIEYKKSMAIYQNEELNSPGWGEVSEADLFISYKNLENSYSNLGRCYKAPKNIEPNCFLAGKPTQWDIELVEVYAIETISDEEYYKMMLN